MQESQWAGLLALAAGAFAMTASVCNWDWFMNSRKARAWVKRIGRNNARLMYGGIGAFVCLVGLIMVIVAPGGGSDARQSAGAPTDTPASTTNPAAGRSAKPERASQRSNSVASTRPEPSANSTEVSTGSSVSQANRDSPMATSNEPDTPPTSAASATPESAAVATIPEPATPSGSTPAPKPLTPPAGGTDLLSLIDPQRDQLDGRWRLRDGALISSKDRPANLQIPADVPASYELSAVVEMLDGNELFSLGLVVGGRGVAAVLSGPGGNNCGLQRLDGKIARQNETAYQGAALQAGENQIVCTVNENRVQVVCNGETIIDWTGDPNRLSYGSASNPTDRLLVGSWNSSCRVSQLVLVPR